MRRFDGRGNQPYGNLLRSDRLCDGSEVGWPMQPCKLTSEPAASSGSTSARPSQPRRPGVSCDPRVALASESFRSRGTQRGFPTYVPWSKGCMTRFCSVRRWLSRGRTPHCLHLLGRRPTPGARMTTLTRAAPVSCAQRSTRHRTPPPHTRYHLMPCSCARRCSSALTDASSFDGSRRSPAPPLTAAAILCSRRPEAQHAKILQVSRATPQPVCDASSA